MRRPKSPRLGCRGDDRRRHPGRRVVAECHGDRRREGRPRCDAGDHRRRRRDPRSRAVCRLGAGDGTRRADRARAWRSRGSRQDRCRAAHAGGCAAHRRSRTQAELAAAVEAARAAVGQAQAELQRATAMRTRAQSTVARLEALLSPARSPATSSRRRRRRRRAPRRPCARRSSRWHACEHELQLARARLKPSGTGGGLVTVVAPVDGVVLKRLRESASVVPIGEPLLEIGDPASLEMVSDLLSTDAVRVRGGDPVLIEQWGGTTSRGTCPPRGALWFHEGLGARRRRAARQRRHRLCRRDRVGEPRRWLSRRGPDRDVARSRGPQGTGGRTVSTRRGLGRVSRGGWPGACPAGAASASATIATGKS